MCGLRNKKKSETLLISRYFGLRSVLVLPRKPIHRLTVAKELISACTQTGVFYDMPFIEVVPGKVSTTDVCLSFVIPPTIS